MVVADPLRGLDGGDVILLELDDLRQVRDVDVSRRWSCRTARHDREPAGDHRRDEKPALRRWRTSCTQRHTVASIGSAGRSARRSTHSAPANAPNATATTRPTTVPYESPSASGSVHAPRPVLSANDPMIGNASPNTNTPASIPA